MNLHKFCDTIKFLSLNSKHHVTIPSFSTPLFLNFIEDMPLEHFILLLYVSLITLDLLLTDITSLCLLFEASFLLSFVAGGSHVLNPLVEDIFQLFVKRESIVIETR
jgi:hypothetical protein